LQSFYSDWHQFDMLDLALAAIVVAAIAPALLMLWLIVGADSRPEPPKAV
jgi:hypothetical protein